ncbi:MAG: ABC transporter substrate-binding protein, partial [Promethearchaeota archaeon]
MNHSKIILLLFLFLIFTSCWKYSESEFPINNSSYASLNKIIQSSNQDLPDIARFGSGRKGGSPNVELDPLNEKIQVPLSLVYEPLVEFDEINQEVVPVLAYQWVVTNDSKHWTFYLRDDIIFHDGSKFNASAVKFTTDRSSEIEVHNVPLESVEIVSEFQVTFHFYEPYASFLLREAQMLMFISPNSFEGSYLTTPIGTGPYVFNLEQSNSTFLHFSRFDQYHEGLAPFKEIHYTIYDDQNKLDADIESQKLDYVSIGADIESPHPYYVRSEVFNRPIFVLGWFNHRNPILANRNVRLAINYGINKIAMIETDPSFNKQPLRTIIPEGMLGYDSSVEGYPYDPKLANELLDQEGYTRYENGSRFKLKVVSGSDPYDPFLENLQDLGIICELYYQDEWDDMGDFDLAVAFVIDFDPRFTYPLLHSTGVKNVGGFSNPLIDSYTTLGRSTPVLQEREYYYSLVQQVSQEESPYLLLFSRRYWYWQSKDLTPYFHLSGSFRFNFNYTNPISNSSFSYSPQLKVQKSSSNLPKTVLDVEIKDKAIYFPVTDAIIFNPANEPLTVTMKMSHNLDAFLPSQNALGKFFTVKVDNSVTVFRFRCYYDSLEVEGLSPTELCLYQYEETTDSWNRLSILASNSSLHYIEVELQGNYNLLRLGDTLKQIIYQLIPFI